MVVRGGRRDGPLLTKGIDRQTDITLYESRAAISDSWQTLEICKLLTYSSHSGYCVKIAHEQRKQGDQFWQVSEDCLLSICLCTSKKTEPFGVCHRSQACEHSNTTSVTNLEVHFPEFELAIIFFFLQAANDAVQFSYLRLKAC